MYRREPGNCFWYNITVSCQIAEVGSRMKMGCGGGAKQTSHRRNKWKKKSYFLWKRGVHLLWCCSSVWIRSASHPHSLYLAVPARHPGSERTLSVSWLQVGWWPWGQSCSEGRPGSWALAPVAFFLSRPVPTLLLSLLMEIQPEAANSSTGHCNAFETH